MISREEADALFKQLDLDGNGELTFLEASVGVKTLKVIQQETPRCRVPPPASFRNRVDLTINSYCRRLG